MWAAISLWRALCDIKWLWRRLRGLGMMVKKNENSGRKCGFHKPSEEAIPRGSWDNYVLGIWIISVTTQSNIIIAVVTSLSVWSSTKRFMGLPNVRPEGNSSFMSKRFPKTLRNSRTIIISPNSSDGSFIVTGVVFGRSCKIIGNAVIIESMSLPTCNQCKYQDTRLQKEQATYQMCASMSKISQAANQNALQGFQ